MSPSLSITQKLSPYPYFPSDEKNLLLEVLYEENVYLAETLELK